MKRRYRCRFDWKIGRWRSIDFDNAVIYWSLRKQKWQILG